MISHDDQTVLIIWFQVSTIEFSLVEVSVLHGLKQGNEVLKEIHKELNVEAVEKLLEETSEAREYQKACTLITSGSIFIDIFAQEIGEMLSNNLTLDEEDAVQTELESLQAELVSIVANFSAIVNDFCQLAEEPQLEKLPDAPTDLPISSRKDHETVQELGSTKIAVPS